MLEEHAPMKNIFNMYHVCWFHVFGFDARCSRHRISIISLQIVVEFFVSTELIHTTFCRIVSVIVRDKVCLRKCDNSGTCNAIQFFFLWKWWAKQNKVHTFPTWAVFLPVFIVVIADEIERENTQRFYTSRIVVWILFFYFCWETHISVNSRKEPLHCYGFSNFSFSHLENIWRLPEITTQKIEIRKRIKPHSKELRV